MSNQSLSSLALTKVAMSISYLPSFTPVMPFTLNVTQLSNDEDVDLARNQLLHENPKSFDMHGHREVLEHELLIRYVSGPAAAEPPHHLLFLLLRLTRALTIMRSRQ